MAKPVERDPQPGSLLRKDELLRRYIPVSKTTLWRMIKRGNFPTPVYLAATPVWKYDEVMSWIKAKK